MTRRGFRHGSLCHTAFLFAGACALFGSHAAPVAAADRIVLRNLDVLSQRTVTRFDEDGVRLDDGSLLGWHEIETARIDPDQQAPFDKLLNALGDPLYRIRQRMQVGNDRDLAEYAEALYPRYVGRRSPTAYLVLQATMWSRMAAGRREAALAPYLRCFEYLRESKSSEQGLPGDRRLDFDPRTGLTPQLAPVWFDAEAARQAKPEVFRAVAIMKQPRPAGAYIYYATLALAAGDVAEADKVMDAVTSQAQPITELRRIVAAQQEVARAAPDAAVRRLSAELESLTDAHQPLAMYWLGQAGLLAESTRERQQGLLKLLHIPASFGERHPELAAAALYRAMHELKRLDDIRGSVAVRNELMVRYGQTYHATRIKKSTSENSP